MNASPVSKTRPSASSTTRFARIPGAGRCPRRRESVLHGNLTKRIGSGCNTSICGRSSLDSFQTTGAPGGFCTGRAGRRLRRGCRAASWFDDGFPERRGAGDPQQHRCAVAGEKFCCDQDQRGGTKFRILAARDPDDCSRKIHQSDESPLCAIGNASGPASDACKPGSGTRQRVSNPFFAPQDNDPCRCHRIHSGNGPGNPGTTSARQDGRTAELTQRRRFNPFRS